MQNSAGIVDGSALGILTMHMCKEMGLTINVDVETDSTAAIGMCSRTGVGKTRHIQVRWLCIQDAIRDKVVRLQKVKGNENETDMGTKDLDGPTHQRLLQTLPLKPTQCRRLLGLIATASGGNGEARAASDEGDIWKLSAQVTIAIPLASLMCMLWGALRTARLINTTLQVRTVERGIQTGHNPVCSVVIPTSVYCSPGGECFDTSRKCEGLQNVPMNPIGRSRSCMSCIQRDGRLDELERRESMSFGQNISLGRSECSSVSGRAEQCCGCFGGRPHSIARVPLRDATRRSGRLSEPPSMCT